MEKQFKINISFSKGLFFEGNIYSLKVESAEGKLEILPNHIPYLTWLKVSLLRIQFYENNVKDDIISIISGGMLMFRDNFCLIATEDIQKIEDINLSILEKEKDIVSIKEGEAQKQELARLNKKIDLFKRFNKIYKQLK